jgi:mRNA interferase MazF
MSPLPHRGEIWLADLHPTWGHEQAGARPVLVISTDTFNYGPADLVFVLPVTRTDRRIPIHVPIDPPEGGVTTRSYIVCDALCSMAKERLGPQAWGRVSAATLHTVEEHLCLLLALPGAQGHRRGLGP